MSSLNTANEVKTADYLDELRKYQAQRKAGNTSQQNFTPNYILPSNDELEINDDVDAGVATNLSTAADSMTIADAMYQAAYTTAKAMEITSTDTTLKLLYKFDSDVNDSSGSGFNGTLGGSGSYVTGKLSKALQFNGTDTVVTKTHDSNISASTIRSISAWFYPTINDNDGGFGRRILQKYDDASNDYTIALNSSGYISGQFKIAGVIASARAASSSISINNMYHVAMVHSGGSTSIYLNGALNTTGSSTTSASSSSTSLQIGRRAATEGRFQGWIDDVRLYNYALSATEVSAIYNNGLANVGSRVPSAGRVGYAQAS